jgi:hypothetical protein
MLRSTIVADWLAELAFVTITYIICFALTFWAVFPLQTQMIPSISAFAMLFFLPHGVRTLSAWLYGRRSCILLIPGSFLTQILLIGTNGLTLATTLGCMVGAVSASMAFGILEVLGYHREDFERNKKAWLLILIAAAVASVINSVGTNWFLEGNAASVIIYLLGDISGTALLFFILSLISRFARLSGV